MQTTRKHIPISAFCHFSAHIWVENFLLGPQFFYLFFLLFSLTTKSEKKWFLYFFLNFLSNFFHQTRVSKTYEYLFEKQKYTKFFFLYSWIIVDGTSKTGRDIPTVHQSFLVGLHSHALTSWATLWWPVLCPTLQVPQDTNDTCMSYLWDTALSKVNHTPDDYNCCWKKLTV